MMTPATLETPASPLATMPETRVAPRSGILAALWISTDERGGLRTDLLGRHLSWLERKGIHGILALGSTGEFARMELPAREHLLGEIMARSGDLPVIANVSSIRLDDVTSLGRTAERLGAAGIALMPPPFFPLNQEDVLEFFLRAAEAIELPVYLYNYPEVTGNRIGPDVIRGFAARARLVGIKQSGGELDYHDELIALGREHDFSVFTAADPRLGEFLAKGAAGCLGGLANFLPEYMLTVHEACRAGRAADVAEISNRLLEVGDILAPLNLPYNARAGMAARGFDPGAVKTVVSPQTMAACEQARDQLAAKFADWDLPVVDEPV